jgi:hypothetical protein
VSLAPFVVKIFERFDASLEPLQKIFFPAAAPPFKFGFRNLSLYLFPDTRPLCVYEARAS